MSSLLLKDSDSVGLGEPPRPTQHPGVRSHRLQHLAQVKLMQGSRHQRTSSAEYRGGKERALLEFKKTETSYSERQWGAPLSPSHIRTGVFTAHF